MNKVKQICIVDYLHSLDYNLTKQQSSIREKIQRDIYL